MSDLERRLLRAIGLLVTCAAMACRSTEAPAPPPDLVLHDESGPWLQLVAGDGATCGLDKSGIGYCWGKSGQLGDGTATAHSTPTRIQGNLRFSMLAMGSLTTCGLTLDGRTYCWGYYAIGHLSTPQLIDTPVPFTRIAVGSYSVCGLADDGVAYCWSLIRLAQTPLPLAGSHRFSTLEVSYTLATGGYCGVTTDGSGYCWGEGVQSDSQVVRQPVSPPVVQIVTDGSHTCSISPQGAAECWGDNSVGELGDGSTITRPTPVPVAGNLRFARLAVTQSRTCGVSVAGGGYCWGQPGIADETGTMLTPTLALPELRVDRVTLGPDHTCFVTPGGAAYCFGHNEAGQLGNGASDNPTEAVRVLDPT